MNYIRLRKNNLYVDNISTLKLVKKYETPFYCYSLSQLKNNYYRFNNAFKEIEPIICFSVKSNANLNLLRELKKMGAGADVVSIGELFKAIKAGINPNKIVFSGIGKTEKEIKAAIKKNILLINIDFVKTRSKPNFSAFAANCLLKVLKTPNIGKFDVILSFLAAFR